MDLNENNEQLSPVKRAIVELREMRAKLEALEQARSEPIAIIGMGCRLPGGISDPTSFWELLHEGRDPITEVPPERWDQESYFDSDPDAPGKIYARHGGFLFDVDQFDPYFFGITPREATSMDPQQRLLLEVSWEALEDACLAPTQLMGSPTGVFVGMGGSDYALLQMKTQDAKSIDAYLASGTSHSVAAGRLSYVYGFEGPSVAVDTACSSSLVAIHQACQSLRMGECRIALAAGANLLLIPEPSINFCKARMLATDGRCKTFDARADGYVRSEGVVVIVLKRLSEAVTDGDRILALIRGSAMNQDGRSSGLTAPNGPSQEAVIGQALAAAGIQPQEVDYVEAHGTGTSLGDPIEVRALGAALCQGRSPSRPLLVGSVKTNIGHLESTAGIAGLMKVVLALQHGEIPAHLHLKQLNPHVNWSELPIVIPTERRSWPVGEGRRIAGVSSFGFSGTNAHVVLEEAPGAERKEGKGKGGGEGEAARAERPLHLLTMSAKSAEALQELAGRYAGHLGLHPEEDLADVSYTANVGRAHFGHRLAVVGESAESVGQQLAEVAAGKKAGPEVLSGVAPNPPEIAFLFTGQGSQYIGMGKQLYETQPTFRKALERCEEILRPQLEKPLLEVLYPKAGANSPLDETEYTQPALFALEYGLAELWKSWGIEPSVVMGHSVGEYVAACVAGLFSLEDGLKLIATRGRLMQGLGAGGQMVAVFSDESRVRQAIAAYAKSVSIAAINGPENVVISGAGEQVQEVVQRLEGEKIKTQRLVVSHAFHSPLIEPMLEEFERVAGELTYREPRVGLVSNVTGEMWDCRSDSSNLQSAIRNRQSSYWRVHVREAVQFEKGMETLAGQNCQVYIEIGPSPVLLGMGKRCMKDGGGEWLPSLRKGREDWQQMLDSLGRLYVQGARVDWVGFDRDYERRKVSLPTYPFQRQRYWIEATKTASATLNPQLEWSHAVEAGRRQSQTGPLDLSIQSFPAKWQVLERLTVGYMLTTLRKFGVYSRKGEKYTASSLIEKLAISSIYRKLVNRWLERLVGEGLLSRRGDAFLSDVSLPKADLDLLRSEARQQFQDYPALLDYVESCGTRLVEVLTGKESPLETLFPGGSNQLAAGLYQSSVVARYFNGIVRVVLDSLARTRGSLNILEIGAGTGGTTLELLPVLVPERTRYMFTDVSPLFLNRAEEKFKDYPFVHYGLLDIERNPLEQGYAAHSFDLVVSANALHATRDLRITLDRVRSLLASHGLLLLLETTDHPAWFDISTGLIEGWQKFEDGMRSDNPLLSPEQWCALLLTRQFGVAVSFPENGSLACMLGQHVLIAQAPAATAATAEIPVITPARRGQDQKAQADSPTAPDELLSRLVTATESEQLEMVSSFVRTEVVKVLHLDGDHPPGREQRLMDLGVDSLMAVELRNKLATGLGIRKKLTATLIFDYPTIQSIAEYLARDVLELRSRALPVGTVVDKVTDQMEKAAAEIEQMEDAEVEALLLEKLKKK